MKKYTREEVLDKWLPALRNGKYLQGCNYLKHPDEEGVTRYCCLGVLDDVFGGESVAANAEAGALTRPEMYGLKEGTAEFPMSREAAIRYGEDTSKWSGDESKTSLTYLNDRQECHGKQEGLTFSEIADLIEELQDEIFTR